MRSIVTVVSLFLPVSVLAMDQPHYDVDSLAYMSTDIVLADLSAQPEHRLTAAVSAVWYGSMKIGEKLDKLSDFLRFYCPMEDGQKVILFLDRRPHRIHFLYSEAAASPFVIPPSGVWLVDSYQHVHEYYQQNNPGPYVAQGYSCMWDHSSPTREQDLALPSLEDAKAKIQAGLKWLDSVRPLLDKAASHNDVSALLRLLRARSASAGSCAGRDRIVERIAEQLGSLNDPQLLLNVYPTGAVDELAFIQPPNDKAAEGFTAARVNYLISTFADAGKATALRIAAARILLRLSAFHSGGQTKSLSVNPWLAKREEELRSTAGAIFDSASQDARLRALCLQMLLTDQPAIQADVRRVYAESTSGELRFAIEDSFLDVGDNLYQSLNPPGGPATSIVRTESDEQCLKAAADKVAFFAVYHQRQDLFRQLLAGTETRSFVLTNANTGKRIVLDGESQVWNGGARGEDWIELSEISSFPAGTYFLTFEIGSAGRVVSSGYKLALTIRETPAGRKLLRSA